MRSALIPRVPSWMAARDHPPTIRENTSSTTARKSHPSAVQMEVVSATHARVGLISDSRRAGANWEPPVLLVHFASSPCDDVDVWRRVPVLASDEPPVSLHNECPVHATPHAHAGSQTHNDWPGKRSSRVQLVGHLIAHADWASASTRQSPH